MFRSFHCVFNCVDLGYVPAGRLWQGSLPGWNMFYGGRFGARILQPHSQSEDAIITNPEHDEVHM